MIIYAFLRCEVEKKRLIRYDRSDNDIFKWRDRSEDVSNIRNVLV